MILHRIIWGNVDRIVLLVLYCCICIDHDQMRQHSESIKFILEEELRLDIGNEIVF